MKILNVSSKTCDNVEVAMKNYVKLKNEITTVSEKNLSYCPTSLIYGNMSIDT